MKKRADLHQAEKTAGQIGRTLGEYIAREAPGWGFIFALFSFGEGGFSTYISNCNRKDMIVAVRELLDKIEKHPEAQILDWKRARDYLHEMKNSYVARRSFLSVWDSVCTPGVNVTYALGLIGQLSERLESGERTQELYKEIMSLK